MAARQLSIEGHSDIADFYNGRSVFITGATGFMGKVLVERLLSSCPGVERLYLLVRPKRDTATEKRLQQLKESQIFDNIRRTSPAQLSKLFIVEGDITRPDLGLSPAAAGALAPVSVVFHTAATVKFDEELKQSVAMNVLAPMRVMDLARQMTKLEAFVHVSTAYCNCLERVVEERVYPPPADLDQLLALCDALPTDLLADITDKYIGERPNTYTFTKAMGEHVVQKYSGQYPVAIFRPTIVTASWSRPVPGWVDTYSGPTGLLVGAGKGIMRTLHCRRDYVADMLPVDVAIDTLIAVGWQTAIDRSLEVKVYNCGTGDLNPIRWCEFETYIQEFVRDYPFDDCLWYPGGRMRNNKYVDQFYQVMLQKLPAYLADYGLWLLGVKLGVSLVRINKRMSAATEALRFFCCNEWRIKTDNVQKLCGRLSAADARLFCLDPASIDWRQYVMNYVKGVRKYLLKEKDQDMDKAKQRVRRLCYLHYGLQAVLIILFLRAVLKNSETTRKAVYGVSRVLLSLFYNSYERLVC